MSDNVIEKEKELEKLKELTANLKRDQKKDLADYTEKFRKLDSQYNALLEKKDNIQAYLDNALAENKEILNDLIKQNEDILAGHKRVLADYEILKAECEKKNKDLDCSILKLDETELELKREYVTKKKNLSDRISEQEEIIISLNKKHENADNIKAELGEEKIELNNLREEIKGEGKSVDGRIKEESVLIDKNKAILLQTEEIREKAAKTKSENEKILHDLVAENAKFIKLQEDIAFRERQIQKDKEDIAEREASIKRGNEEVERKMAEADKFYNQWKIKLARGE